MPSAAGRLLAKEVDVLGGLLTAPAKPFVAILGGVKVSDKLGVINALLDKVDTAAHRRRHVLHVPGRAGPRRRRLAAASRLRSTTCKDAAQPAARSMLPEDVVALGPERRTSQTRRRATCPKGWKGLDIGPYSAAIFSRRRSPTARTVLWNGPMGVFEDPRFEAGTRAVAEACADADRAFTVIGGGDSAAAVAQFKLDKYIDHISTGGGASLELIEQGDLPGLAALRNGVKA